jgi:ribosomal protein S18 acetylase RimI-like enzyme
LVGFVGRAWFCGVLKVSDVVDDTPQLAFDGLGVSAPVSSFPDAKSNSTSAGELAFFVRSVRRQDLTDLTDLLATSFHSQEGWLRWVYPLLKAGIYEDLKSRFHARDDHYACLVAVKSLPRTPLSSGLAEQMMSLDMITPREDLLGTVEMGVKKPSLLQPWEKPYLYLSNLAVRTEYRRNGIAQQLLQSCERTALDWGFHDLYLHVLASNHQARRLYWKAGYRLHRIEVNPVALMFRQPRQLFLRKQLS